MMTVFIIYVIKWALALTVLYSLYGVFLRRETFHTLNRVVLVGILCTSMLLPFCTLPSANRLSHAVQSMEQRIGDASGAASSAVMAQGADDATARAAVGGDDSSQPSPWFLLLVGIYMVGLCVYWFRYVRACVSLGRIIAGGQRITDAMVPSGVHLIVNDQVRVPCSWMRWIMMSRADLRACRHMVLQHEMAHVRNHHSWDMLLADVTVNMLWFLPFAHMLRTDLGNVHEYQADRAVMHSDVDADAYHHLLIDRATARTRTVIVNSLSTSDLKQRLAMMFRSESGRMARLKVLYLLPLTGIVLLGYARPHIVDDVQHTVQQQVTRVQQMAQQALPPAVLPADDVVADAQDANPAPTDEALPAAEAMPAVQQDAEPLVSDAEPHYTETPQPEPQMADTVPTQPSVAQKPKPAVPQGPVAEDGLPVFYDLPLNTNPRFMYAGIWLERRSSECLVHLVQTMESDDEICYVAGEDTYIMNRDTQVFYHCRGTNMPRAFNTEFHVRGMRGKTVDFTLIFPALPEDYQYLNFVSVGTRRNDTFYIYRSDLEPSDK